MRWSHALALVSLLLSSPSLITAKPHEPDHNSNNILSPRQWSHRDSYSSSTTTLTKRQSVPPREAFGLKTADSTHTSTGINVGFHIDWIAGEKPETLNLRLGKNAAIIGGYIHLNLTNQTYWEMTDQIPSLLPIASTTVYSPAVLPQFTLDQWTTNMTQTLASQMASLNAQGITVWLRFAYEMNGLWMDFGQEPTDYIRVWQEVATAVRAVAPQTYLLWAPNIHASSTSGLDGYTDYYPGISYVDMAGLSFYDLGTNQVTNDVAAPDYFTSNFQSFYDLYGASHWIVMAETSSPQHYYVPTQFADLPEDSELPGGADAVDFSTLSPAVGTATSELQRKSTWFGELTSANTTALYPKLLAVMWFNLAKIGGYNGVLRLNDYRAVKLGNDTVTAYFRSQIGNDTAYQLGIDPSVASSTTAKSGGTSSSIVASGSGSASASASTATSSTSKSGGAASLGSSGPRGSSSGGFLACVSAAVLALVLGAGLVW